MSADIQIETDVLVIGGGLAGVLAAIRARDMGANVILVDKGYVGKSGGAAFGAIDLGVFNPKWGHDLDTFKNFIISVGEYINNRDWIEIVLKESYARYQDLISWGVHSSEEEPRDSTGKWLHRFHCPPGSSYGVQLAEDVTYTGLKGKRDYMPVLRERVLEVGAKILDRLMAVDLMKQEDRIVGAIGFHAIDGDFYTIKAKATILATGSCVFKAPGQPMAYWTADGESMGYRAGADITGKEFGGKDNGRPKDSPTKRDVGLPLHFINALGDEFLPRYTPGFDTFDRRTLCLYSEVHAGRAPIFGVFEPLTSGKTDMTKIEKVEWRVGHGTGWVRAAAGVFINTKCESTLPGLYAAGICAGTHFMGSCYAPTGYGLMMPVVTGYRAGENAASFALANKDLTIDKDEVARLNEIVYAPLRRNGGFSPGYVTEMLRNLMIPYYIVQIKHGERLQAALTLVKFMEDHLCAKLRAKDAHELRMAHEVRNMALNAEMMLVSSLFRTESRGTHYREDYPNRKDPEWLAWTVLKNDNGEMKPTKLPIPKEWWPDLSKSYEERYKFKLPGEVK